MSATAAFTQIFLATLVLTTLLRIWLGLRQIRHVCAHRGQVPPRFADGISLEEHHKAADYTMTKAHLSLLEVLLGMFMVLAFTQGGLLQYCADQMNGLFPGGGHVRGLGLFALVGLIGLVVDLPFALYRTFVLEARFGFNKTTPGLFVSDLIKQVLLAVLLGGPLLLAVLWLMERMGAHWWFWVWLFWLGFNLLMLALYPTLIAPLFNRFTPLTDEALKARIEALLQRCGFRARGLFVMDGSKRSAHGNAYFTGFGAAKRIVFFDTLLEHLTPAEVEAVLAHELGHFKHRHLWKRLGAMAVLGLGFLWLLGQLMSRDWFFAGLGVSQQDTAMALLLFSLVLPVFSFPLSPLFSALSRRHEYQADAYAVAHASGADLSTALVKLYRDNASTLTPDPIHSLFYDSHPPASLRIARLSAAE
ncbi:M48 family metallopeptidase [Denitratisoma oestradiolicum]|uniref:Peptidase M48 n=1 Tax=Denitratisoma oestradiolicum TaxID=311182 RepID=A0A6S6XT30_9PROT|nr:M48 family metallopeptidase [Denitratisoma oestradiolicum]TWO81192.1 peptidase M48 [Denitratisoma oestradiolicum]CAB1367890.1 Peptidase M48 [Denitratisoma oestradiolicum]